MRTSLHTALLFLLLWLSAGALHAQAVVSAVFDSAIVETGELFFLNLTLSHADDPPESTDFSAWEPAFPKENLLQKKAWERQGDQWTQRIGLIAFDADTLLLPPLTVRLRDGGRLQTQALELVVVPTPTGAEINDMQDIKDIHREPAHWTDYLGWILLVGGLLFLAVASYLLRRWWHNRKERARRRIKKPPHELALQRLRHLEKQQLWQNGNYPQYYLELSQVLREYLQERYQFPALESVTAEILEKIVQTDFPAELLPPLDVFLHQSELAKFAKFVPAAEYHEQAFAFVQYCVRQTIPQEPSDPSTQPNA